MKQAEIHLITGGQRSGKSAYAERLALENCKRPIYLATSKVWDEEYKKRIMLHQEGRSEAWINKEELLNISQVTFPSKVVLLDCITLWLTNVFDAYKYDSQQAKKFALSELKRLFEQHLTLFIVSAELGMGIIPMQASTRQFVDLHGEVNQYIAKQAKQLSFMVAGIPLQVK
ncbi:bifunctional adenosylcobinamide kinase/adenosylcobinamide-phosphate guanylyltransferase [Aureispira anguillae]|uniref:Adenosylcobinamide kinase n=1 Tax=Aureispira anguillae TaxID=2864201 RepID=A0A916DRC1_9BACT|nr:bifunctional adenosylcobinamide kinase/adenosylcobinamide-phosphate guanylyltransferase [Aureispira anguillae]BDS11196.1 bifunctional adenosylcobinamide kinase/adenosylcobinamide-phosphate guanylyltransferase [Aureispira anguillae]